MAREVLGDEGPRGSFKDADKGMDKVGEALLTRDEDPRAETVKWSFPVTGRAGLGFIIRVEGDRCRPITSMWDEDRDGDDDGSGVLALT